MLDRYDLSGQGLGIRNSFKLIIILADVKSHIHSPSNPLEPHTFLKGRKNPSALLSERQNNFPWQLLKSVPFPLPVFSSQGRNECGSTETEKERKKYFWERRRRRTRRNQPIFIPLQQAFIYEDKQVERQVSLYEMESGLYQKILLVPTVIWGSTEMLLWVQ